jgi:hypothetical protein
VPADVAAGIASGDAHDTYAEWVTASSEVAGSTKSLLNAEGGFGTPTVVIDGERFENWQVPGGLTEAITGEAPASEEPSAAPSAEPSE